MFCLFFGCDLSRREHSTIPSLRCSGRQTGLGFRAGFLEFQQVLGFFPAKGSMYPLSVPSLGCLGLALTSKHTPCRYKDPIQPVRPF